MAGAPPPFSLKVGHVFDAFTDGKRGVTVDDICAGFQKAALEIPSADLAELHSKSDANGDGLITFPEWLRMAEQYPTLMDCLYYRSVDGAAEQEREKELGDVHDRIEQLRRQQQPMHDNVLAAEAATQDAEESLQELKRKLSQFQNREHDIREEIDAARNATEQSRGGVREALEDLNSTKDAERQAHATVQEAINQVEKCSRRATIQSNKVAQAEESVKELEKQLLEARRRADDESQTLDHCNHELQEADGRQQESKMLHQEALRRLHAMNERIAEAESGVKRKQAHEKELAQQLSEYAAATNRHAAELADAERRLAASCAAERQQKIDGNALVDRIEREEARLMRLADEHREIIARRELTNAEEQPLVEKELNLRKQREMLEHNEAQLNHEVSAFAGRTQRSPSPARGGGGGAGKRPSPLRSFSARTSFSPQDRHSPPILSPPKPQYERRK